MLHTAVLKPKVDFVRELISTKIIQPKKVLSIYNVINKSKNIGDFKENLSVFTNWNIETIEKLTMTQSENEHRFEYCKCLITASKAHEVVTKMTKGEKLVVVQLTCGPWNGKGQNWFLLSQIYLL